MTHLCFNSPEKLGEDKEKEEEEATQAQTEFSHLLLQTKDFDS